MIVDFYSKIFIAKVAIAWRVANPPIDARPIWPRLILIWPGLYTNWTTTTTTIASGSTNRTSSISSDLFDGGPVGSRVGAGAAGVSGVSVTMDIVGRNGSAFAFKFEFKFIFLKRS